jgi:hypothetical protein
MNICISLALLEVREFAVDDFQYGRKAIFGRTKSIVAHSARVKRYLVDRIFSRLDRPFGDDTASRQEHWVRGARVIFCSVYRRSCIRLVVVSTSAEIEPHVPKINDQEDVVSTAKKANIALIQIAIMKTLLCKQEELIRELLVDEHKIVRFDV